ncbi:MAG TPA: class I SAM-dependent methyltransferase [Longimicrobiales bacterium]|nr:class I SAM-dependent methyltransferase [Longimicrobiales bacterium]
MKRSALGRAASLLRVLRRDPAEFADRVGAILAGRIEPLWHARPDYPAAAWPEFVASLPPHMRESFETALVEDALAGAEGAVTGRPPSPGIDPRHDGDLLLARCCYAVVRSLRPATVIETGVARGVTSTYILSALAANDHGTLHSIDLPPVEADGGEGIGALVPDTLRGRWQLHRGMTSRVLPTLLDTLGGVDVFVHDSLHTYGNMRMEFGAAWPRLGHPGAIVADDVEGNRAFLELRAMQPAWWGVCREGVKPALFGLVLR